MQHTSDESPMDDILEGMNRTARQLDLTLEECYERLSEAKSREYGDAYQPMKDARDWFLAGLRDLGRT